MSAQTEFDLFGSVVITQRFKKKRGRKMLPRKPCARCGAKTKMTDSKYCSRKCRDLAVTIIPPRQCNVCDKTYVPRTVAYKTCCSRECGFIWLKRNQPLYSFIGPLFPGRKLYMPCGICGVHLGRKRGSLCSRACANERDAAKSREDYKNNFKPSQFKCVSCGDVFTREFGNKRQTCTDACRAEQNRKNKRRGRLLRKMRERAAVVESFDPFEVFARDGWTCSICSKPTPIELRGTYHPQAPELDHIIPLAKGGEHSRANVQCLCRSCNGIKSDTYDLKA